MGNHADVLYDDSLLNLSEYEPQHRPVNGQPNPIVKKWGPPSQVRWFQRFWGSEEMPAVRPSVLIEYHCSSILHKGPCCDSCLDDYELGYDWFNPERCCCRAEREA